MATHLFYRRGAPKSPQNTKTWWTFRIFLFFFLLGGGEGGVRGAGRGGGRFLIENHRRGGSPERMGAGPRGAERVFAGNLGGGG